MSRADRQQAGEATVRRFGRPERVAHGFPSSKGSRIRTRGLCGIEQRASPDPRHSVIHGEACAAGLDVYKGELAAAPQAYCGVIHPAYVHVSNTLFTNFAQHLLIKECFPRFRYDAMESTNNASIRQLLARHPPGEHRITLNQQ